MKAVILGGGKGERLRPLTDELPKPLVKVNSHPILYWQIRWLKSIGIDSILILAGYKAEKIKEYVESNMGFGSSIEIVQEKPEGLGTAYALRNAMELLEKEEKFFVINGDNITNIDIRKMELSGNALCVAALVPLKSDKGVAVVEGSLIKRFEEKPVLKDYFMNAGMLLMHRDALKLLPEKGSLEIMLENLAKEGRLLGMKYLDSYMKSIDSFKDLKEIEEDMEEKRIIF